ncbi:MAG: hypothetical protein J5I92_00055, partial [Thiogranum sp.]|nr:hypothetical protein [Thiogranum sp.]
MNRRLHRQSAYRTATSWMLVVSLLLLALVPLHYHLHHDADAQAAGSSAHAHIVDVHILANAHDADHHADSHALDPVPDITLKKPAVQLPLFAVLLTLFILMPRGAGSFRFTWPALT